MIHEFTDYSWIAHMPYMWCDSRIVWLRRYPLPPGYSIYFKKHSQSWVGSVHRAYLQGSSASLKKFGTHKSHTLNFGAKRASCEIVLVQSACEKKFG
jgi:hypothetical protein